MKRHRFGGSGLFALATLLAASPPVRAQDAEAEKPFTLSGSVTLVSDYRWRGVTLSNRDWAIQGGLQVSHSSGLFIGTWASSISPYGGSTTEVDVFGGWSGNLGPLSTTVGLYSYLYPGGVGVNFFEVYGSLGYQIGTLSLTAGLNWAPDQGNLAGSSRYLFGSAAFQIPETPITVKGSIGSERGSVVVDNTGQTRRKFDWLIGVDISGSAIGFDPLTIGFAYSGNDLPDRGRNGLNSYARSGFVFSIGASF
ncbi:MAG: TorF family putative porin [Thermaurantiacus tibetensis]|uniref:TorF family putative porin n=1 Tax=Thermaurantiacus tibetensis TaxID=2759035 RepID=UPI00188EB1DD|nr:TorF family putative porin [Thermaurantiacus tibetensis]